MILRIKQHNKTIWHQERPDTNEELTDQDLQVADHAMNQLRSEGKAEAGYYDLELVDNATVLEFHIGIA